MVLLLSRSTSNVPVRLSRPLYPDAGGASTQIIFRHKQEAKEEQQQRQQPEQQQQDDDDEDERRARENGSGSGRARVSETPAASQGGSGDYDPLDNRRVPLEAIEERGSVPTVPVSQSDFWGASHLGFGVAEVRALRCFVRTDKGGVEVGVGDLRPTGWLRVHPLLLLCFGRKLRRVLKHSSRK